MRMNKPPTTDLAWKRRCVPSCVQYQSVSGTRLGDSWAKRYAGANSASKSSRDSARLAVQTSQSSLV